MLQRLSWHIVLPKPRIHALVGSIDPYYIDSQSTREVVLDVNGLPGAAKQIKPFFEVSKRPLAPIAACGLLQCLRAVRAGRLYVV